MTVSNVRTRDHRGRRHASERQKTRQPELNRRPAQRVARQNDGTRGPVQRIDPAKDAERRTDEIRKVPRTSEGVPTPPPIQRRAGHVSNTANDGGDGWTNDDDRACRPTAWETSLVDAWRKKTIQNGRRTTLDQGSDHDKRHPNDEMEERSRPIARRNRVGKRDGIDRLRSIRGGNDDERTHDHSS